VLNDARGGRRWIRLSESDDRANSLHDALTSLCEFERKEIVLLPSGPVVEPMRRLVKQHRGQRVVDQDAGSVTIALEIYSHGHAEILRTANANQRPTKPDGMTHLDRLEAESMHIIREVMAEADNPVMLYSVGKDSSVMLHLARKAFYPSPPPFPLLHVDTRWKFQAMYDFRDYMARESGMDLLVHVNPEGVAKNINPFDHGSALHTDIMKTEALKQALDHYKFDVAFGGARRDEEKSRAKERVFSFRTSSHRWDPKNQRPELWNLYNGKKNQDESIRVFPISNWTELDIWQYIYREQIPIVPLYFAAERPVIERDGMLMMVDDDRLPLQPNEQIKLKKIRFRTLGCYPLTGAIQSEADDLASIVLELLSARTSERQGRAIDTDSSASMEKKKQEGYF
jgi:sulfate adenylyltransferase subunit 2